MHKISLGRQVTPSVLFSLEVPRAQGCVEMDCSQRAFITALRVRLATQRINVYERCRRALPTTLYFVRILKMTGFLVLWHARGNLKVCRQFKHCVGHGVAG